MLQKLAQRSTQYEHRISSSLNLPGSRQSKSDLSSQVPFALRELRALHRRLPSYLLYGSTGSGKGVIVDQFYKGLCKNAGHDLPYEVVEFNANPGELLHSSLFGIGKKTASGVDPHPGRIALADGGLIHFDEIGKTTSKITNQILTWMERGHFHRPGNIERKTSRAIAVFTMSENPYEMVHDKKWGIDFLSRFRNIIKIPSLAENTEYILQFANTFAESCLKTHTNGNHLKVEFSKGLQARIKSYNWPGNIRELENTVDRWVMEVIAEEGSASQSTIILKEELFDRYPPNLKPLDIYISKRESPDAPPRNLKECGVIISSHAIAVLEKAKPYLSSKEWDSARGCIKRHKKKLKQ